jgi:methylmalonyl-CoA mutase N-terminal domain/subunit
MREAGATALQELSFTFANAITYIDTAIEHGLTIDEVAPQMSFFFNCHNNFLEEVSKFRAARVIWARITKEIYKAKNPKSSKLRFHTQTAGSTLTASQPHNNIIRTSIQAMASVLGGTQSLHTNGFDEALGLPTEQSAEIALRTQQIIANETGITDTSDPLGGSYVIENLTSQLIDESFKELDKIKSMGGMLSAIQEEYPQKSIEESAYEYQKELEKKEKLIVGVNCFNEKEDSKVPVYKLNAKIAKNQIKAVLKLKKKRNVEEVKNTLRDLETVVRENRNAMPYIITAAKNRATLGEISDAIKKVYGSYSGKF